MNLHENHNRDIIKTNKNMNIIINKKLRLLINLRYLIINI